MQAKCILSMPSTTLSTLWSWTGSSGDQTRNPSFMNFWCRKSSKATECIWKMFHKFNCFTTLKYQTENYSMFHFQSGSSKSHYEVRGLIAQNPFCAITAYCTKLLCAITALIAQYLFCPISLPIEEALLHKTLCLRTSLDGASGC